MRGKLALVQAGEAGRGLPKDGLVECLEFCLDCFNCKASCTNGVDTPLVTRLAALLADPRRFDAWTRACDQDLSWSENPWSEKTGSDTNYSEKSGSAPDKSARKLAEKSLSYPNDVGNSGGDFSRFSCKFSWTKLTKLTNWTYWTKWTKDALQFVGIDAAVAGNDRRFPYPPAHHEHDLALSTLWARAVMETQGPAEKRGVLETLNNNVEKIVVPPAGMFHLRMLKALFEMSFEEEAAGEKIVDFAELLASAAWEAPHRLAGIYAFHDPCVTLRDRGEKSAARRVLKRLLENPVCEVSSEGKCCGAATRVRDLSRISAAANNATKDRWKQFHHAGVDAVITTCPLCREMLSDSAESADTPVYLLSEIVCKVFV